MSIRAALGRFLVYVALITGAVIMVFPFYWMLSTSVQTRQEAGQAEPVLVPQKMHPDNWLAAWRLGRQGTGGSLAGAFTGGWEPGGSLEFDVEVRESEPGAGLEVVVPRPSGVLSFPLGDQTEAAAELLEQPARVRPYPMKIVIVSSGWPGDIHIGTGFEIVPP